MEKGSAYGYSYYKDGRLKEKRASGRTLVKYEYDLNGNKTKQTDVTGKTTEYIYDLTGQIEEIREGETTLVRLNYSEEGTRREAISQNGLKRSYTYDGDKNLMGLKISQNGKELANNRYAYDFNGNRVQKKELGGTTHYQYDRINQLKEIKYPECEEEVQYDGAGNRKKRRAGGVEESYNYDRCNRLIRYKRGEEERIYTYDPAGNVIEDGERNYQYDGFNRTERVITKSGEEQVNRYDAEGLRYEVEENGRLVEFIYNGNKEVIAEESAGKIRRLIRRYELWASECTHEKTWYHYASDEQGSIVFITDGKEVRNRYEYDAWGNETVSEEQIENRYRYTGQQYDPVTQQYDLRARYYNPAIARFTQEDEYRGDGLNLYAYCDNNPVMYVDPTGYSRKNTNRQLGKNHQDRQSGPNERILICGKLR